LKLGRPVSGRQCRTERVSLLHDPIPLRSFPPMSRRFTALLALPLLALPTFAADADVKAALIAAHGADQLDQVKSIEFTFNVARADGAATSRSWYWEPATGLVRMTSGGSVVE